MIMNDGLLEQIESIDGHPLTSGLESGELCKGFNENH
jgi:hypothetical protein